MADIKRYHMIAEGMVQGVGFRSFCMYTAQTYNLTGSVRNMDNGNVEIYVQGTPDNIDSFIARIEKGDRWIRVDHLSMKEIPVDPHETRFSYAFGGWNW